MVIHCLVTLSDNKFYCWQDKKNRENKMLKLRKNNPKIKIESFDIDPITSKHQFNNSTLEVRKYYNKKLSKEEN